MKYLISISYDGSKFNGFQRQKNKKTVQGELEKVLTKLNKSPVTVKSAGRTDKGAHALDQKCHFDLDLDLEKYNLMRFLNDQIDKSIYVNDVIKVKNDFHARFMVKNKIYKYILNVGKYDPISKDYVYNYNHKLNVSKMKKASKLFLGEHSFENFVCGKRNNYDCYIKKIKIIIVNDLIYFEFQAKSFYTYMVRNMVGALIEIGKGKMTEEKLKKLIDNKEDIISYTTVPASGLYLVKIEY